VGLEAKEGALVSLILLFVVYWPHGSCERGTMVPIGLGENAGLT